MLGFCRVCAWFVFVFVLGLCLCFHRCGLIGLWLVGQWVLWMWVNGLWSVGRWWWVVDLWVAVMCCCDCRGCVWWVMAWVVVVGLMGHGVGCECDGLLFAGLMFCGFSCSVSEKRETKRKREKEIEMMMNKK